MNKLPGYLQNGDLLLLFANTHRVLQAERILEDSNTPYETIPKPTEISNNCGLAIRIRDVQPENIFSLFNPYPDLGLHIYNVMNDNYIELLEEES